MLIRINLHHPNRPNPYRNTFGFGVRSIGRYTNATATGTTKESTGICCSRYYRIADWRQSADSLWH